MGAYEEDQDSEQGIMNVKAAEKQDYMKHREVKQWFTPVTEKKERLAFVGLLLVIIVLIIALIAISTNTKGSASSHGNNEKYEKISSFDAIPDSTDDETVRKNQNSAPCDDDWIWYRGKCHYFSTDSATWNNSLEYCRKHNASLAHIDNKEEYDFMVRYKGPKNHWIGLRRTDDNKAWAWINGTTYNENLFTIQRSSPESIESVLLNHDGVDSQEGGYEFKWICNKM